MLIKLFIFGWLLQLYFKKYNAVRSLQGGAPQDRSAAGWLRGLGFGPKDVGEVGLSRRGHCGLGKYSMNREVRFSRFL